MKQILLLAPLDAGSGNAATAFRIADGLHQSSHMTVECMSVDDVNINPNLLSGVIHQYNAILALHAYRAGHLLVPIYQNSCNLPTLILIFAGTDLHSCESEWESTIKQILPKARGLVCFSEQWKYYAENIYKTLLACPITVIPQSVPMSLPIPGRTSSSEKTIIWAGAIRTVKDPLFAVRIMSHLVDYEFQLVIIGNESDPSLASTVRSACSHLKVTLVGGQPTHYVHERMRTGFVYLNTSVNEGMCLAILEAMAIGLPVIVRRNTGNTSIVNDGQTGLLFETPEQAAKCVLRLENETQLRETLIKQATDQIKKVHNRESESTAYRNLIMNLIE